MTGDSLRELPMAVVRDNPHGLTTKAEPDEFSSADGEPLPLTNLLCGRGFPTVGSNSSPRDLAFARRQAFRWGAMDNDRPSRSRRRTSRGCSDALNASPLARGDAEVLVDAHEYAGKVIEVFTCRRTVGGGVEARSL